jgi:hypothetical protein
LTGALTGTLTGGSGQRNRPQALQRPSCPDAAMTQGIVAGIDWASEVHVASVLGENGAVAARFSFTHDAAAIRAINAHARQAQPGWRPSAVTGRSRRNCWRRARPYP